MNKLSLFIIILTLFSISSCTKIESVSEEVEVQNFVWKGLNAYYLWKDDVPELQDNHFLNQDQLNSFVTDKTPKDLFYDLLYKRGETDKWSWIVNDYVALEQLFAGARKSNGMKFGLVEFYEDSPEIFGYVQYIIPNSEAANLGVQRGDIIYGINGQQLTRNNYSNLLSGNNYTVNFGTFNQTGTDITVTQNNINITLNKEQLDINPIHTVKIHETNGHKIGYLFYNQFVSNYDSQLNNAFLQLKNANITDLVLDLRYNGGGSVQTAVNLASMITGQYSGELFAKEQWNAKWQSLLESEHPEYIINNFTNKLQNNQTIYSLNLTSVTIIVTNRSASASELVINGLKPYIDVNLIGTTTHGKYVGSVTLYDSDSYRKDDKTLSNNHQYALQPIVLEIVNKLGENKKEGFTPDRELAENYENLGELGNPAEPLFELAINSILGIRSATPNTINTSKIIGNSDLGNPLYENMFVDLK